MTTTPQGRERSSSVGPPPAPAHPHAPLPTPAEQAWRLYRQHRALVVSLKRRARREPAPELIARLTAQSRCVLDMRNQLVERHLPVLAQAAERLALTLPRHVEKDDLMLSGAPALIQSIERFRPARGNRFETFAAPRLRGAMLDALRKIDPVPRLARRRNHLRAAAAQAFFKRHGRPPTDQELRDHLPDLEPAEQQRVLDEKPIPAAVSLDAPRPAGRDSDPLTPARHLAGPDADPLGDAARQDLKRYLTEHLPRRERLMVILFYYEQMTMQEVATTLGISESRVSQCLKQVRAQLRVRLAFHEEERRP